MKIIKGSLVSYNSKIAIVIARFNDFINNNLLHGAIDTLERIGKINNENITVVWVPGTHEIPITVNALLNSNINKYDAVITLGTVIRGVTIHFDYIVKDCSSKLFEISLKKIIPIVFGVLVTENIEQAIERAGTKMGNKGINSALTALEMINILKILKFDR